MEKPQSAYTLYSDLTREDDRWVFRQMHFQWDDNQPDLGDLLRRRTYVSLLMDAFR
jgi:hypothetical protein